MNYHQIANIGECYTLYKLAQLGIKAIKVSELFEFDLLAHNNIRIEVKTAIMRKTIKRVQRKKGLMTYSWNIWEFCNTAQQAKSLGNGRVEYKNIKRNRMCDFFVFVCLDKDYNLIKSYIIPKEMVRDRRIIVMGEKEEGNLYNTYKERWDLIKERSKMSIGNEI